MFTDNGRQHPNQENAGVTIVIVTYNSAQTIVACLQSVEQTLRTFDEVVLVDNGSTDQTLKLSRNLAKENNQIRLIANSTNRGYAAAANQGAASGTKPYIVFLNPDTIVTPKWLERLIHKDIKAI